MTLAEALPVENVALDWTAPDKMSAVIKIAHLLKHDERMLNWRGFYDALLKREREATTCMGSGLAVPHARGDFVDDMAMGLVRWTPAVPDDDSQQVDVRYMIVVAFPIWMAADYLRLVGALVRVFKDAAFRSELDATTHAGDLVGLLVGKIR